MKEELDKQARKEYSAILKELAEFFHDVPQNVLTSSVRNFHIVITQNLDRNRNIDLGSKIGQIIGNELCNKERQEYLDKRAELIFKHFGKRRFRKKQK